MLRPGHVIALCVLALLSIAVVMVTSAMMSVERSPTPEAVLWSRNTILALLALGTMGVCALLPVRRLLPASVREGALPPAHEPAGMQHRFFSGRWFAQLFRELKSIWPLWAGTLGILLVLATVYAPVIGDERKGSHRWINLHLPGLDSIQPSEFAKWGLVALLAWFGARYAKRMGSFWLGLVPGLIAAGAVAGFVVIEDLGTGALIGAAAATVLLAAGCKFWHMLLLVPFPAAGAWWAVHSSDYRMKRIEAFMDPFRDPQGVGFHMIQSMSAIAGGQGFGRGLGHGLQKFEYLPEDHTDFIFAVINEELGIAGAAIVIFLLGLLLTNVFLVSRRERTPMLKLFALGVMAVIGVQALINLAVVTGLGPPKGIALPLVSQGGTGWILMAGALGLVIAIDRAQAREGARLLTGRTESPVPAPAAQGPIAPAIATSERDTPAASEPKRDPQSDGLLFDLSLKPTT